MLVNANIKSTKEAAERLLAGEIFFVGGSTLFFDPKAKHPFCHKTNSVMGESICGIYGLWEYYDEWQIEVEENWWDTIPEQGIVCFVSSMFKHPSHSPEKVTIELIVEKTDYGFKSMHGDTWKYAEPVNMEYFYKQEEDEK